MVRKPQVAEATHQRYVYVYEYEMELRGCDNEWHNCLECPALVARSPPTRLQGWQAGLAPAPESPLTPVNLP